MRYWPSLAVIAALCFMAVAMHYEEQRLRSEHGMADLEVAVGREFGCTTDWVSGGRYCTFPGGTSRAY